MNNAVNFKANYLKVDIESYTLQIVKDVCIQLRLFILRKPSKDSD